MSTNTPVLYTIFYLHNIIYYVLYLGNTRSYRGDKTSFEKSWAKKANMASLGAHLSLIAMTVFLSFGLSLSARLIEIELKIQSHMISGIRMFKLSMCCALFSMMFLIKKSKIRFNREWFMRLCGLMLGTLLFLSDIIKEIFSCIYILVSIFLIGMMNN